MKETSIQDFTIENRRKIQDLIGDSPQLDGDPSKSNNFGRQKIRVYSDFQITAKDQDGVIIYQDNLLTNGAVNQTGRDVIVDALLNGNSVSLSKIVTGSGTASDRRRSVNSLSSPSTSTHGFTTTKSRSSDKITLTATTTKTPTELENETLLEIGLEASDGTLLQYDSYGVDLFDRIRQSL